MVEESASDMEQQHPTNAGIKLAATSKSQRYYLRYGKAVFSTPATSLEQAFELAADEFPNDEFEAIECPDCTSKGRTRRRYAPTRWECEDCGHSRSNDTDIQQDGDA